jgi:hypothetical protein
MGINPWRAHFSSEPVAIKGEHLPTEVGYNGFWLFVQKFFGYAHPQFLQLSRQQTVEKWTFNYMATALVDIVN